MLNAVNSHKLPLYFLIILKFHRIFYFLPHSIILLNQKRLKPTLMLKIEAFFLLYNMITDIKKIINVHIITVAYNQYN